jgi:tetratricopeptide (TPR) repeat protein
MLFPALLFAQKKDSLVPKKDAKEDALTKRRKYNYFVSDRLSEDDKYDIFRITPTNQSPSAIIVRGHLDVIGNPNQKKGRISVFNISNGELVGVYNSSGYTGNYIMVLVPNVKYSFKVEVSGYGLLEDIIEVPMRIDYEICRQDLKIKLNEQKKPELTITNFFVDENEKVFYLRSKPDTTTTENALASVNIKAKDGKNENYSSIDELVKKQLEDERKKPAEALKAFKSNDLESAFAYYSALIKNDPADPFMNYYYGICLLKLGKNRAKAINSLQLASHYKEVPSDVFYHLGSAYHLSYLFNDAIQAFNEYRRRAKPAELAGSDVNRLISNCNNGVALINEQVNIEVIKRSAVQDENIISSYDPDKVNEAVKYKTEFFNSSVDKKRQEKLMMCSSNKREVIYVSYGEDGKKGKDLYRRVMLPNGSYSGPQLLGAEINTELDENYPYMTPDGKALYFSSKGHNSMGGYDIFKCIRPDSLSEWSKPVNMGYPINSTYDDILFVADTSGEYGAYCSNRKGNGFEYLEVKTPHKEITLSVIKGSFVTSDTLGFREAIISVFNSSTGEIAGVYKANSLTGSYIMILNAGLKYDITVEAENYPVLSSNFELPPKKGDFTLKQLIKFETLAGQKSQKVTNYFTEGEAAKVNFDVPVVRVEHKPEKKGDAKKEVKQKKPSRTPEEIKKDEEDLAQARSLYNQAVYQEAAILFQNLEYHMELSSGDLYSYGLCLYHSKKDKTDCIRVLELAAPAKSQPADVFYYLAKACQMSYKFSAAIGYFKKFATVCKPAEIQKLSIDKEIEYCTNGIRLVNNPVVIEVYEKRHVDLNSVQNSLTGIESGAKVLVITDDMRSSLDRKKNYKSLLYLSPDKTTVLYSSYGDDDKNGKDIYMVKKLSSGKWATPQHIDAISSEYDEEYPALSKDGKTIYFSSKGFENMGGYDIFKSVWDEKTETWSAPVNLGSPINSPFDDIYFLE